MLWNDIKKIIKVKNEIVPLMIQGLCRSQRLLERQTLWIKLLFSKSLLRSRGSVLITTLSLLYLIRCYNLIREKQVIIITNVFIISLESTKRYFRCLNVFYFIWKYLITPNLHFLLASKFQVKIENFQAFKTFKSFWTTEFLILQPPVSKYRKPR